MKSSILVNNSNKSQKIKQTVTFTEKKNIFEGNNQESIKINEKSISISKNNNSINGNGMIDTDEPRSYGNYLYNNNSNNSKSNRSKNFAIEISKDFETDYNIYEMDEEKNEKNGKNEFEIFDSQSLFLDEFPEAGESINPIKKSKKFANIFKRSFSSEEFIFFYLFCIFNNYNKKRSYDDNFIHMPRVLREKKSSMILSKMKKKRLLYVLYNFDTIILKKEISNDIIETLMTKRRENTKHMSKIIIGEDYNEKSKKVVKNFTGIVSRINKINGIVTLNSYDLNTKTKSTINFENYVGNPSKIHVQGNNNK